MFHACFKQNSWIAPCTEDQDPACIFRFHQNSTRPVQMSSEYGIWDTLEGCERDTVMERPINRIFLSEERLNYFRREWNWRMKISEMSIILLLYLRFVHRCFAKGTKKYPIRVEVTPTFDYFWLLQTWPRITSERRNVRGAVRMYGMFKMS